MPKLSSFAYDANRDVTNSILINTKLLSYSSFVTLYFIENSIEHYFATGKIINIQDNDIAQVVIIHFNDRYNHKKDEIISNNIDLIGSIVVKLSFHDSFINTLNLGGI